MLSDAAASLAMLRGAELPGAVVCLYEPYLRVQQPARQRSSLKIEPERGTTCQDGEDNELSSMTETAVSICMDLTAEAGIIAGGWSKCQTKGTAATAMVDKWYPSVSGRSMIGVAAESASG